MLRFITQITCLMFTTIVCVFAQAQVSEPAQAEKYGVHEITITYDDSGISNVWMNVPFSATFTTPSGASKTIDGFYYNTDTWNFRFSPSEVGNYTWTGSIYGNPISGSFTSVDVGNKGFLRLHPNNYNRWIREGDGSLFTAAGFQTWMTNKTNISIDDILILLGTNSLLPVVPLDGTSTASSSIGSEILRYHERDQIKSLSVSDFYYLGPNEDWLQ